MHVTIVTKEIQKIIREYFWQFVFQEIEDLEIKYKFVPEANDLPKVNEDKTNKQTYSG